MKKETYTCDTCARLFTIRKKGLTNYRCPDCTRAIDKKKASSWRLLREETKIRKWKNQSKWKSFVKHAVKRVSLPGRPTTKTKTGAGGKASRTKNAEGKYEGNFRYHTNMANFSYRPNIDSLKEKKPSQFCIDCGYPIMPVVARYSLDHYGKVLCRTHQKNNMEHPVGKEYNGGIADSDIL